MPASPCRRRANYYAQRYTVDFVAVPAERPGIEQVTVISFAADLPEVLTHNGVHTSGVGLLPAGSTGPFQGAACRHGGNAAHASGDRGADCPGNPLGSQSESALVLPLFADSFRGTGLKGYVRNRLLAWLLNRPAIEYVANHNLAASLDLARIGVARDKILPFDWPEMTSAKDYTAKPAPAPDRPFRLLYVGQLSEPKGVGDTIRALAILRRRGLDAQLTPVGAGETDHFMSLARQHGVGEQITLTGLLPHDRVLAEMRAHDIVLVPSHHDYPRGFAYDPLRSPLRQNATGGLGSPDVCVAHP